jgi:hypothetical protein
MKRNLFIVMIVTLALASCVSASAEEYQNESYGLCFTLPEGWSEIPDENQTVYEGPADSDSILLISLTDRKADDAFAASFDAAAAEQWMRESLLFSEFTFTGLTTLMFAGAMDGNGRLYAIHMCLFGAEEFPQGFSAFYAQLFFTDENGMLGDVSLFTPATQGNPFLSRFDAMTKENIPQDAYAEIAAQLTVQ